MLGWIAETTLVAAVLALVALGIGRLGRVTAETRHALWLVVLIKFLLPPIFAWPQVEWEHPAPSPPVARVAPILEPPPLPVVPDLTTSLEPRPEPVAPVVDPAPVLIKIPAPTIASTPSLIPGPQPTPPAPVRVDPVPRRVTRFDWSGLILAAWLVGSVVVAASGLARVIRFGRILSRGSVAPAWLVAEVAELAERFGVRPPRVVVVPGLVSPLLWCLGRPRLIVPEGWDQLTLEARSSLIAHELAHLSRRDHWVVRLELGLSLVWWWNPVFRLARRRVRDEAELACDARVVRAFPDGRRSYAEALINVCEHQSRPVPPLPALGIGGPRAAQNLEARLKMILRDPVRPPARWAAPLALVLLGLSLPTWTRGQQDPPPLVNPSVPIIMPPPAVGAGPRGTWTLEDVVGGMSQRFQKCQSLAFRYVASRRLTDGPERRKLVEVEVADVALGRGKRPVNYPRKLMQPPELGMLARFDVLAVGPRSIAAVPTADHSGDVTRFRRFTARSEEEVATFAAPLEPSSPVPIQWLKVKSSDVDQCDSLANLMLPSYPSAQPNQMANLLPLPPASPKAVLSIQPLPSPLTSIGVAGSTRVVLQAAVMSHTDLVGVDQIDGVDAVRIAWTSFDKPNLRGICWVAPARGFAVLRLEAFQTPDQTQRIAGETWRWNAAKFERVGDLWLPGQVTYQWKAFPEATQIESQLELVINLEDYQVDPPMAADTFHPKLDIDGLDPKTGLFTATPPAVPAGLAVRLDQAIAASPFGPPRLEVQPETATVAVVAAEPPRRDVKEITIPAAPAPVVVPQVASEPATNSTPVNVHQAQRATQLAEVARAEAMRDVASLKHANTAKLFQSKAVSSNEVSLALSNLKIAEAGVAREQGKLAEIDAQLKPDDPVNSPSNPAVLQARRDAQAAEVVRVEAERDLAGAEDTRNKTLLKQGAGFVSKEVLAMTQFKLAAAEATVVREKARLAEADALLAQAKEASTTARDTDLAMDSGSPRTLADWRDQVELLEFQLRRNTTKLSRSQNKVNLADQQIERANEQVERGAVKQEMEKQAKANLELAQAELATTKFAVEATELQLKQTNHRLDQEEDRIKREVERARDRMEWSRKMIDRGVRSIEFKTDRARYDDLMSQLDPNYKPEPALPVEPPK